MANPQSHMGLIERYRAQQIGGFEKKSEIFSHFEDSITLLTYRKRSTILQAS